MPTPTRPILHCGGERAGLKRMPRRGRMSLERATTTLVTAYQGIPRRSPPTRSGSFSPEIWRLPALRAPHHEASSSTIPPRIPRVRAVDHGARLSPRADRRDGRRPDRAGGAVCSIAFAAKGCGQGCGQGCGPSIRGRFELIGRFRGPRSRSRLIGNLLDVPHDEREPVARTGRWRSWGAPGARHRSRSVCARQRRP